MKRNHHSRKKKVTVSGTVLDTHGEPVIGASVLEKGVQGNGTITDIDGIFKLSVSSSKAQLDISYIGYQSQTVAVQVGKNLKKSFYRKIPNNWKK